MLSLKLSHFSSAMVATNDKNVLVIGAGNFGTCLADHLVL